MLLKTFKGKILAVTLGMTIFSVVIFGYGLANIYYHHMEKCLTRSLSFLTNIVTQEYDLSKWDPKMVVEIRKNEQMQNILKGGLLLSCTSKFYLPSQFQAMSVCFVRHVWRMGGIW